MNKPFRERREKLHAALQPIEGEFAFAQYGDTSDLNEIQTLLDDSVKASCEGLMVKMLDGPESNYEPSRRSQNWLKVKKDYLSGVGDSLDLVVLGAYFGRGKRTSVYGAFLLACYNPSTQVYETVCNIGTGFSEAVLEEFHAQLKELVIERPKPFYAHAAGNNYQPDVWFEAKYVWEVKTADLTLSPRYKAAADQLSNSGGRELVSGFRGLLRSGRIRGPSRRRRVGWSRRCIRSRRVSRRIRVRRWMMILSIELLLAEEGTMVWRDVSGGVVASSLRASSGMGHMGHGLGYHFAGETIWLLALCAIELLS